MIPKNYWFPFLLLVLAPLNLNAQYLESIHSWAYQLENASPAEIAANSTFQMMVMDYSSDGTEDGRFSADQIARIKNSGKTTIAYISIGEAEDYRWYWKNSWKTNPPGWLGPENPNWEGNYKVRFWDPAWQKIVFTTIDTILSQGFDGIYCDIIDAYYYWREENPQQPMADSLMVQFLIDIRNHISQKTDRSFYILPQNGEMIIKEDHVSDLLRDAFWKTIDGIGVEDVFCPGDKDEDNAFQPDAERLSVLKKFLAHKKSVFSVEYLTEPPIIQQYLSAAGTNHFVPYVSTRPLNRLYNGISTRIQKKSGALPNLFHLYPNYPNPFNPATTIDFSISTPSRVSLQIFNSLGQIVLQKKWPMLSSGRHRFYWRADQLPGGVYMCRLRAGTRAKTQKAVLLK